MSADKPRFVPVNLSRNDVRRIYARLARVYDSWGFLTESKALERALELADVRDGEAVLEVAVGTGKLFEQVVARNPDGRNEGVDLSPAMLAVARKRLRRAGDSVTLQVADAANLPFPDDTFDLVFNSYMFDLLPEAEFGPTLGEFRRVLKSGGRMVLTSMTPGRTWYSRLWDRLVARFPSSLEGCRPITLAEDVRQAGFESVREDYVSQLTFPSLVIRAEKP